MSEDFAPNWVARAQAAEAENDRLSRLYGDARAMVEQLNDALSHEWPGIADRLDGTDLEGIEASLSVAWDKSAAALAAARAFFASHPTPEGTDTPAPVPLPHQGDE